MFLKIQLIYIISPLWKKFKIWLFEKAFFTKCLFSLVKFLHEDGKPTNEKFDFVLNCSIFLSFTAIYTINIFKSFVRHCYKHLQNQFFEYIHPSAEFDHWIWTMLFSRFVPENAFFLKNQKFCKMCGFSWNLFLGDEIWHIGVYFKPMLFFEKLRFEICFWQICIFSKKAAFFRK